MNPMNVVEAFEEGSVVTFFNPDEIQRCTAYGSIRMYVAPPGEPRVNGKWVALTRIFITTAYYKKGEIVTLDPAKAAPYVRNGFIKPYPPLYEPPEGTKRYKAVRDVVIKRTVSWGDLIDLDYSTAQRLIWNGNIKAYVPPPGEPQVHREGLVRYEVTTAEIVVTIGSFDEGEITDLDPAVADPYIQNGSLEPYGWSLPEPEDDGIADGGDGVEPLEDQPELPDPDAYTTETLSPEVFDRMMADRGVRATVCSESPYAFFHVYFAHAVEYDTAAFHREMFHLIGQEELRRIFIVSFRGSGKSTIFTSALPLWSIMGKLQKKFVLIICDTLPQAKLQMDAIKQELEGNALLKNDLGPFEDDSPEWGAYTIVFKNFNARILVTSVESKIRGIHHGKYRPDLIVCDDVESTASVQTKEGRNKVYRWLKRDVIGAGEFRKTRLVVVGNLLHENSLLMRLKREVKNGEMDGVFRAYPLVDKNGRIAWPNKYPTEEAIREQEKEIGNKNAFLREFMLKIVPEDDQVITRDMIHYYDKLPQAALGHITAYLGVDLAIGQKEVNDYTSMLSIVTQGTGKNFRAYVLPNPVNERMRFPEIIAKIKERYRSLKTAWSDAKIRIESNQFQQASVDQLKFDRIREVEGVVVTVEKRSRLASCADLMNAGVVLFPRRGAEDLIAQMTGFGVENHDDIMDSFTLLVHSFIEEGLIEDRYDKIMWI